MNLLKRGMRMLAPSEMKLPSKNLRNKALLGLLHQNIQELHHSPNVTAKWGTPPPKNQVQPLTKPKLRWEHPKWKIPKSQELLSKRVFRIHRALVLK
jgi:hypothetical protein